MSALITTKLVTRAGTIGGTTTANIVDRAGNLKESAQFLVSQIVDYSGNLGQLAPGPWEIQVGTVETVGSHLSRNATAYVTPFSAYASQGCTGYIDGVLSGTAAWTIQSSPQTINGISYPGFGLLVATANSTLSTTTMQTGTHLQLGELTGTTGTIRDVTLATGAVLDIYGANTTRLNKVFLVTNNAGGTVNWKGPGVDGQGILGNQNTYNNLGVTNIDDCEWALGVGLTGTGTINVLDGGTFFNNGIQSVSSSNKFFINGCGWKSAAGVAQGAISVNANTDFFPAIHVQSAACLKVHTNGNTVWRGLLTGSAPLTVSGLGAPVNGIHQFINTANTYDGTMTVDGTTISQSTGTSLQFAKIVLANGGRIGSSANTSQTIGSLASSDSTTYWVSGDFTTHTIKANGITTFAGRLLWNGGTNTAAFFLEGGSQNELTMTGTGNTGTIYARNGARLVMNGATFTGTQGQIRANPGGTVSLAINWSSACTYLLIDGTSKLEVRTDAIGNYGRINCNGGSGLDVRAGWKVDWPDVSAAGSFTIIVANARVGPLPTTGVNNTGRTITYAWSGNNLVATLV